MPRKKTATPKHIAPLSIRLSKEQDRKLEQEAKRRGASRGALVRELIVNAQWEEPKAA